MSFKVPSNAAAGKTRTHVAWCLRTSYPFDPLVVMAYNRCLFIWDTRKRAFVGFLRGHGGPITSIAVHPISPNIFATTSTDFTTRIYNLDILPDAEKRVNPIFRPWKGPSTAGAAQGFDHPESDGSGIGRLAVLLAGGIYGGHLWDVTGAAFHATLPLIATCGADHYVKIWRCILDKSRTQEDKPIFSAKLATSRILGIKWLSEDLLLVQTGRTYTPSMDSGEWPEETPDSEEPTTTYEKTVPGQLVVFQWLSLRRFFPRGRKPEEVEHVRFISTDWQTSNSHSIIAKMSLKSPREDQQRDEWISNIGQQLCPEFGFVYPEAVDVRHIQLAEMPVANLDDDDNEDDHQPKRGRFESIPLLSNADASTLRQRCAEACVVTNQGDMLIVDTQSNVWQLKKLLNT
uniref:Coatomer beta subunit n=1 Tax=Mycena chlorophos TaxID=658473 RepID=A0ABQ0KYZ5_MYCCL|nr:coatomer beta subunit [Mycena chlorophos]